MLLYLNYNLDEYLRRLRAKYIHEIPWLKYILYVVYHLYFTQKIIGTFDKTYHLT